MDGEVLAAIGMGVAAGLASGMLGVGGGILFVPALALFLDHSQLTAESTSLLAIVPVALVGAWRQHGYGNVRVADGVAIGVLSFAGAGIGAVVANAVPQRGLEIAFALLLLVTAVQLARRALSPEDATA